MKVFMIFYICFLVGMIKANLDDMNKKEKKRVKWYHIILSFLFNFIFLPFMLGARVYNDLEGNRKKFRKGRVMRR